MHFRYSMQRWQSRHWMNKDVHSRIMRGSSWTNIGIKFQTGQPWWSYAFKKVDNYKVNRSEPYCTTHLFTSRFRFTD
jgi:hypothetical protein